MDVGAGVADLHLHTTASDGTCSVDERVEQAVDRNLDAIAITDHDCVAPELSGRVARRSGVELVTGVEVRGDVAGTKVELLGYYLDPTDDELEGCLGRARQYRRDRNRAMVETLADETGLDVEYDDLANGVDGMLGRPHLAQALVDAGTVDSIGEAFDSYLGADGSAFVPMERVPAGTLVEAIQGAGGVASLAHPGRIRSESVRELLAQLVDAGLDAIEVRYPYDEAPSEGYAEVTVADAAAMADQHDLLRTGGSDCHGPGSGKFRIGRVRVTAADLDAIRGLADSREPL